MRQPIGLYLTEFAAPGPVAFATAGLPHFDVAAAPAPSMELACLETPPFDPPMDGIEPAIGLEAATGFDASPEPAELPPALPEPDTAAVVAALEAEHAAALTAARRQWAEQEGASLAAGLAAALAELEARIAETLAPLLEPFLAQAAQITALAQLRETLGTLLAADGPAIRVSGPADLLDALRTAFPERPAMTFVTSDEPDVTVTAGDTRIHSQLASWARALESALGEAA